MAAIAVTQGFSAANGVNQSSIVQDSLAQGAIPHRMLYAIVMGRGSYLITSLVMSGGISGLIRGTQGALVDSSPIGWIVNPFLKGKTAGDYISGNTSKGFLRDNAPAKSGAVGAIVGFYLG